MRHLHILLTGFIMIWGNVFAQHTYTNVSTSYGVSGLTGLGHAVGWGDINDDGLQDLAISNQDGSGLWMYRNDSTGFTDITASAGLSGLSGDKMIFADISGDYYPELILRTRSGTSQIFLNDQDETFTDITTSSGISGKVCAAADFNNDGNLDIFAIGTDALIVFSNNGNNTFTSNTISSVSAYTTAVTCLDYNNDNYTDIYLSITSDGNGHLFRNNGDMTFTDVADEAGVETVPDNNAVASGDYNNDGLTDIYIGSYDGSITCKLFENNGDGTFEDVTVSTGTQGHNDTRTVSFGDYNNDGFSDILSSHHDFYSYSNTLQKNNSGASFSDVAVSMGISGMMIGDYFGVGWADFNNDADMDFFAAGHIDKYSLFRNDNCPDNSFILNLKGVISNKSAVDTKAELWIGGNKISRTVTAGQGLHDMHSLRLHFGMGDNTSFDSLLIYWPSTIIQKLVTSDININAVNTVFEEGDPANVAEDHVKGSMHLFPNPACNNITVESGNTILKVEIFDYTGKKIREFNPDNKNETINISAFKNGFYMIRITTNTGINNYKILKT